MYIYIMGIIMYPLMYCLPSNSFICLNKLIEITFYSSNDISNAIINF